MDENEAKRRLAESRLSLERSSFRMRPIALTLSAIALIVAVVILVAGFRANAEVDRLIARGRVVQGTFGMPDTTNSENTCDRVDYVVEARHYTLAAECSSNNDQRPIVPETIVAVPRLGPEKPGQVVYLPGDPAVARLRDELFRYQKEKEAMK